MKWVMNSNTIVTEKRKRRAECEMGIICRILMGMVFLFATGCAEIKLNYIPDPPLTTKLRISVIPLTGFRDQNRGSWAIPSRDFSNMCHNGTAELLENIGFYEIIPEDDLLRVTGRQDIDTWKWRKNGWQLARDVGRSLHADYVIIILREFTGMLSVKVVLINTSTNKQYEYYDHTEASMSERRLVAEAFRKQIREAHEEIFRQAKGDMLATAVRKMNLTTETQKLPVTDVVQKEKDEKPVTIHDPSLGTKNMIKTGKEPQRIASLEKSKDLQKAPDTENYARKNEKPSRLEKGYPGQRLVIHDLQANSQLSTVALILSEALREEFSLLGRFDLINRTDINQALQEMRLLQAGLADDQQALQVGKWLVANQTVTGNLGIIGSTIILQSRMTDLQTMKTISHGSIRTDVGKEEELLHLLPSLAKKLCAQ